MIDKDKREFGGWFMWVLRLLIVAVIAFTGLRYVGVFGEAVVFKNSFQYKEARISEIVTFQAALTEIEIRLSGDLEANTRTDLEAQAAGLRIQLRVARSK